MWSCPCTRRADRFLSGLPRPIPGGRGPEARPDLRRIDPALHAYLWLNYAMERPRRPGASVVIVLDSAILDSAILGIAVLASGAGGRPTPGPSSRRAPNSASQICVDFCFAPSTSQRGAFPSPLESCATMSGDPGCRAASEATRDKDLCVPVGETTAHRVLFSSNATT
jgi:hypothetical protein